MKRILFVCHGNICRSPMGEFILKDLVKKSGLETEYRIDSAAVSTEEIGSDLYPPARKELQKHGIPCSGHRARQITEKDLTDFDVIYYMDQRNARRLEQMFPGKWKNICRPLLNRDVADPWYTGDFSATWEDLNEGCRKILEER